MGPCVRRDDTTFGAARNPVMTLFWLT